MSGAWWGRERGPRFQPAALGAPVLLPADRSKLLAGFAARTPAFTPEWTPRSGADDAGAALRQVFGEQLEAVVRRLDNWPEKALVEFLTVAGINALPGTSAEALLEFQVAESAPQSVLIPAGFQVGARPPGADQLVVFEVTRSFTAAPGRTGEVYTVRADNFDAVDPGTPFEPLGDGRFTDAALMIGLTGSAAPTQTLTLAIGVTAPAGAPPPVGAGSLSPLPVPPGPALVWEIFDGGAPVAVGVVRDETAGLSRSGLVELALPRQWRPGPPPGLADGKSVRYLRLRVAYGRFARPPQLDFVTLNMIRAVAAQSVLDEVPAPVPDSGGWRFRLSQVPVVAGSLVLEVDDDGLQVAAATGGALPASGRTRWQEVPDLVDHGPDDAVFELDPGSGELTFGDGQHGRALPVGYRNVHAVRYQAQSLSPGPIDAETITTILTSVEFVQKVSNPQPAAGGGPGETTAQAVARGPLEIRTRGRAVTVSDYALQALRADGADVARAFAVSGLHPNFPGLPIPGVVGVFVVPPDRGQGRLIPTAETLRGVAEYLAARAAPAGVEVVAAAPRYQDVRIEAGLVFEATADTGATVRAVLQMLDAYLHPLTGGESGDGWPFGGSIRYVPLVRRIGLVPGVQGVPRLNVILDGIRTPTCTDVSIQPCALLWPGGHRIFVPKSDATP